MNIEVTARRLRVFRFVKEHMELYGECPTSGMVAEALDISRATASDDMRRLKGADGLPLALNNYQAGMRIAASNNRLSRVGRHASGLASAAMNAGMEPLHSAPVDLVMRERRAIPAWAAGDE